MQVTAAAGVGEWLRSFVSAAVGVSVGELGWCA